MMRAFLAASLVLAGLAGCSDATPPETPEPPATVDRAVDDVVVVAVIDSGFNPYHWDFLGSLMPQHTNNDTSDDLPLAADPSTWVPGYPQADAFASYDKLALTLSPTDDGAVPNDLHDADADEWAKVQTSSAGAVHMRWIPGTKIIGAVTFGGSDGYASGSHGVGTSSVSVGNIHGTCPHCLLVFVDGTSEAANEWVDQQDWIDLQTNSWGFSFTGVARDRVYAGSDTQLQLEAVDRGQSIFFSAGNGLANDFSAPNPTLFSSQEGPDWIITVGAITPDGDSYSGHGRPAEIASVGSAYPSAYGATTVTGEGGFGGTSNATPVTAGMYAEALYHLRRTMTGASRIQEAGTISQGSADCGPANADCAVADGNLTVHELREALFRGSQYISEGIDAAGATGPIPATGNVDEVRFLSEGHGSFWGRMQGDSVYAEELARIVGYAMGEWFEPQDADQLAWFQADSVCRQSGWGTWENGYAPGGTGGPGPDPNWPARNWFTEVCPTVLPQIIAAEGNLPRII